MGKADPSQRPITLGNVLPRGDLNKDRHGLWMEQCQRVSREGNQYVRGLLLPLWRFSPGPSWPFSQDGSYVRRLGRGAGRGGVMELTQGTNEK